MKSEQNASLERLLELSRSAPSSPAPVAPPGFAARIARQVSGTPTTDEADPLVPVFRWAILCCIAVTVVIAAINAPSVVINGFNPNATFESHISDLLLLKGD